MEFALREIAMGNVEEKVRETRQEVESKHDTEEVGVGEFSWKNQGLIQCTEEFI